MAIAPLWFWDDDPTWGRIVDITSKYGVWERRDRARERKNGWWRGSTCPPGVPRDSNELINLLQDSLVLEAEWDA